MKRALKKKIVSGFAAALFMMALVGFVSYTSMNRFAANNMLDNHSRAILNTIAELSARIKEVEASGRGFVITGDDSYAGTCGAVLATIMPKAQELRSLTADSASQQQRLDRLLPLIQAKSGAVTHTLDLRKNQGFDAAKQFVTDGEGQRLTDRIRGVLDDIAGEENRILAQRSAATVASKEIATAVIAIGSLLGITLIGMAGWMINRDMAARKRAEEELDRFFTISLDMLCIASSNGYFKRVSPAFTQTLGWSVEELVTRPFIDFVHPDDAAATLKEVERQVAAGEKVMHFENRYLHKDGSWRMLAWRSVPQPDGRMYATARDVTESREQDRLLREAKAAADQASESKSRFLANMSHEIRTPMAAIIGYADLILDPTQSASDRFDHINTIRRNGEHLLTLINDILDLSKIEAGRLQVERVSMCPCQVLSDVASLMRIRAAEKKIRLDIKNEGTIPARIRTDPSRLRQILINLVGNAIKFTEDGFVQLIMKLEEPQDAAPRLRFDVSDTGVGMTSDQLKGLFQPFAQADASNTRRFGGTGLGLTISKRLAEMLGGTVTVISSPGVGSTFSITIDTGPLDGVPRLHHCREALAGINIEHPLPAAGTLNAAILLVDDGEDNRRLLSVYLRSAGAHVVVAENGRIGVDKALEAHRAGQPFDVILMDMQMPVLDGYSAAALLRAKGYTASIIALTANAMAQDADKCLSAGCTDYLSKPVRREKLVQTVARHVNNPQARLSASTDATPAVVPALALPSGTILSEIEDASLRPFLFAYIRELPVRVAELESLVEQANLDQLRAKVHNLKGSGGLYGLMPITDAAAKAEQLLLQNVPLPSIHAAVNELTQIIRRVEGFEPPHPSITQPNLFS